MSEGGALSSGMRLSEIGDGDPNIVHLNYFR